MAKENVTLTLRNGNKEDFDESRMVAAEMAAVLDTEELYISFQNGKAKRVPLSEEVDAIHEDLTFVSDDTIRAADFAEKIRAINNISDGRFYPIYFDTQHTMQVWRAEVGDDGAELEEKTQFRVLPGSDYIKCPKHLCLDFADSSSRCYIYFYTQDENGEYVNDWSVLPSVTTSQLVKNFYNPDSVSSGIIDIPDGRYMQVYVSAGAVNLYGWDGELFGAPLSADVSVPVQAPANNYEYVLPPLVDISTGITVPGEAEYFICANGYFTNVLGSAGGAVNVISETRRKFIRLPGGYDFFRIRVFREDGKFVTGDVSDIAAAYVRNINTHKSAGRAANVLDNCKTVFSLKWKPVADIMTYSDYPKRFYREGVEYNGLPYCSQWDVAHYVGWHVSPHTFVNAVNDNQSVIYTDRVTDHNGVTSIYYGAVCTTFATMCDGWDYPQTNAGYVYDPAVDITYEAVPPIGKIYSNLTGHCVIPQRIDTLNNAVNAISVYEAVKPIGMRTTRYSNITSSVDLSGHNVNYADGYYDQFGYAVKNRLAKDGLDNVPYADFDDVTIIGGSARPHRGDRSVYTSEDTVLINIKDTTAATLYLVKDGGGTTEISISGAAQIDVSSQLSGDGIYYVYTDVDSTPESFEYHVVTPITWILLDNGEIKFSDNDFWYAACYLKGFPLFVNSNGSFAGKICCVPADSEGDYSKWVTNGAKFGSSNPNTDAVATIFKKGEYGAYTVPLIKGEATEDDNSDSTTGGTSNYNRLTNKPKINGITLEGNLSSDDLGIATPAPIPSAGVNLLHNADWAYSLVNQRGHSGAVTDAYCIDRWIGNGNVTPVAGQYVTLVNGTTITQRMEVIPESLIGRECTFSIDVDGSAESVTVAFPGAPGDAANVTTLTNCTVELGFLAGSFTLCDVTCSYVPYVKITATADINVKRVFLEYGEVSHVKETPPRHYGKNLTICQRYFYAVPRYTNAIGVWMNATYFRIISSIPKMRISAPSVTILMAEYYKSSTWNTVSSAVPNVGGFGVAISGTAESNTIGAVAMSRVGFSADAEITA